MALSTKAPSGVTLGGYPIESYPGYEEYSGAYQEAKGAGATNQEAADIAKAKITGQPAPAPQPSTTPAPAEEMKVGEIKVTSPTTNPDTFKVIEKTPRGNIVTTMKRAELEAKNIVIPTPIKFEAAITQYLNEHPEIRETRGNAREVAAEAVARQQPEFTGGNAEAAVPIKELAKQYVGKDGMTRREAEIKAFAEKHGMTMTAAANFIDKYKPGEAAYNNLNKWEKRDLDYFYRGATGGQVAYDVGAWAAKQVPMLQTEHISGGTISFSLQPDLMAAAEKGIEPDTINAAMNLLTGRKWNITRDDLKAVLKQRDAYNEVKKYIKNNTLDIAGAIDAGIDRNTINRAGFNITQQSYYDTEQVVSKIKEQPEELQKAFKSRGIEAYNAEVERYNANQRKILNDYVQSKDFQELPQEIKAKFNADDLTAFNNAIDDYNSKQLAMLPSGVSRADYDRLNTIAEGAGQGNEKVDKAYFEQLRNMGQVPKDAILVSVENDKSVKYYSPEEVAREKVDQLNKQLASPIRTLPTIEEAKNSVTTWPLLLCPVSGLRMPRRCKTGRLPSMRASMY